MRAVAAALFEEGAEAVQETADGVVTHLRNPDAARVERALRTADADAEVAFEPTPDVDWSSAWRERIGAHRVGRFVVVPPWRAAEFGAHERIVIEPAMAFGTGEHESTRGALRLMQKVVRAGDVVADLGAGSAVLAIAAARLGARRAIAIEMDPDAIENAELNVEANGVGACVSVVCGDVAALLPLVAPVRVVLANIVSSVLEELLPSIAAAVPRDGAAVLAGLLVDERDRMRDAVAAVGWRVVDESTEGAWWSATIAPR